PDTCNRKRCTYFATPNLKRAEPGGPPHGESRAMWEAVWPPLPLPRLSIHRAGPSSKERWRFPHRRTRECGVRGSGLEASMLRPSEPPAPATSHPHWRLQHTGSSASILADEVGAIAKALSRSGQTSPEVINRRPLCFLALVQGLAQDYPGFRLRAAAVRRCPV